MTNNKLAENLKSQIINALQELEKKENTNDFDYNMRDLYKVIKKEGGIDLSMFNKYDSKDIKYIVYNDIDSLKEGGDIEILKKICVYVQKWVNGDSAIKVKRRDDKIGRYRSADWCCDQLYFTHEERYPVYHLIQAIKDDIKDLEFHVKLDEVLQKVVCKRIGEESSESTYLKIKHLHDLRQKRDDAFDRDLINKTKDMNDSDAVKFIEDAVSKEKTEAKKDAVTYSDLVTRLDAFDDAIAKRLKERKNIVPFAYNDKEIENTEDLTVRDCVYVIAFIGIVGLVIYLCQ
jgi:hypothetical protein